MTATTWHHDLSQLSFVCNDKIYGSPEGLLASIAQPEPTLAWDGTSHLYNGKQFFIGKEMAKQLKLTGTIPEYTSFDEAILGAKWMLEQFGVV